MAFAAFVAFAASVALVDWRRGWLLALIVGVLQDPARKLTPGTPVIMTFSILIVYAVVLFSSHQSLQRGLSNLARRYPRIYVAGCFVFIFLIIAAVNGLATFGIQYWKVPMVSFVIYLMPIPAVAFGYIYLDSEERLIGLFRLYAVITSLELIGTPLEYFRVQSAALGMVALPQGFIRYMPGIEIRILSGFYRAPDIMGWHAAMLTIIGITMALKRENLRASAPWIVVTAWGFTNCLLSGRRKATYMVAVFAIVFAWRYMRRMNIARIISFVAVALAIAFVVHKIASNEESSVYTQGTVVTSDEIFARLEGGVGETVTQVGFLGAGLGAATQGTYHLVREGDTGLLGWQEGGLAKLTAELGVPGVGAVTVFVLIWTMVFLSGFPDEEESSQLIRVALFGIVVGNIVNFLVSAQAYSDPVLTLMSAFFVGALLGTAALKERREVALAIAAPPNLVSAPA